MRENDTPQADEHGMWGVLRYVPEEPDEEPDGLLRQPSRACPQTGPATTATVLASGHARAVAARVDLREVGRGAVLLRRAGRGGARPGQGQAVLALEEPLAAHAAGGAALARVLVERGELGRRLDGVVQRCRASPRP